MLAARGIAIIYISHRMAEIFEHCDRITVMRRGEVLVEGSYQEVSAHPAVIEAYMGKRKNAA